MSKAVTEERRVTKKKEQPVIAFKGLDKDFRCRDFQFEVGQTYEHDGPVEMCRSGFHACLNPLDVLRYYPLIDSRFAVVALSGATKHHDEDTKIAAAKITITAELSLPEFVQRAVEWVIESCKGKDDERMQASIGDYARLASSGDSAQLASSGYSAQLASSGDYAQLASSGDSAQLASSGDYAQLASSGDYARLASIGDYARLASSGYYARLASIGDYARLASSGYYARLEAKGEHSVIASSGYRATVKGSVGTWISLAEYDDDGKCVGFAVGCIGQDGLEPDTYYRAEGGKLVKVEG